MDYYDEVGRYRKKSKRKPPKKFDHKHVFEPCVLEYNNPYGELSRERGFITTREARIDGYCPMCGKIGSIDMTPWEKNRDVHRGHLIVFNREPSDAALRELDPLTRTLPTFDVGDDWCLPKFVKLPEDCR